MFALLGKSTLDNFSNHLFMFCKHHDKARTMVKIPKIIKIPQLTHHPEGFCSRAYSREIIFLTFASGLRNDRGFTLRIVIIFGGHRKISLECVTIHFSLQLDLYHCGCVVLQSEEHTPFMRDHECNLQS